MPYRRHTLVSTQSVLTERIDLLETSDAWSDEYASNAFKMVVPLSGHFYARTDDGEALIDGTSVMVSKRDGVYRMRKPVAQSSIVMTVHDEALCEQWMLGRAGTSSAIVDSISVSDLHALTRSDANRLMNEERSLSLANALICAVARVGTRAHAPARSVNAPVRCMTARMTQTLSRAREFLLHRCCDDISLSDVASAAFVSPYQLSRVFKARYGVAVFAYRERLRIAKAFERLSNRRNEIADLAFELGYASHSHFTVAFKRATGMTPSAWATR